MPTLLWHLVLLATASASLVISEVADKGAADACDGEEYPLWSLSKRAKSALSWSACIATIPSVAAVSATRTRPCVMRPSIFTGHFAKFFFRYPGITRSLS